MTKTELQRLLRESTSTLKNTSKDDSCTPVQYMTTITEPAINFDGFMQKYINSVRAKRSQKAKSCDALLETPDSIRILIEFKNGKLDSKVKEEVRHKMTASCLCLLDTLDEKVDYAREKFDFILVYNGQKIHVNHVKKNYNQMKFRHLILWQVCREVLQVRLINL